jgi:HEAT repeat protein
MLQDNPSAVRDVSSILEQIVDYAVGERDPRALGQLIALIRDFQSTHQPSANIASMCEKLEERLVAPSLVQSFEDDLAQWSTRTQRALEYFEAVGRPVVDPLLKILHSVEGGRLHREICGVLVKTAGDEIEGVLDRLDIDNTRVARDAVYIAGKIGIQTLTPRVQELLYYPDVKVKEEMLEIVSRMSDPAVPDLLMSAATDADKAIRCKAMQTAAARGLPQMARHLSLIAFSKGLHEKDADEQEALFRALGHVGDAETVERLRKFVGRRNLVDFSGKRENKMLAIRALEHIQDSSAADLLQKLSRDSNEGVRTRARRALTARRKRMQDPEAVATS